MTAPLKPCGTSAAYNRHFTRGEPIDEACRKAHAARVYAAYGHRQRARIRALTRMAALYPAPFAALLAEENAKGDGTTKAKQAARNRAQGRLARDHQPAVYDALFAEELAKEATR